MEFLTPDQKARIEQNNEQIRSDTAKIKRDAREDRLSSIRDQIRAIRGAAIPTPVGIASEVIESVTGKPLSGILVDSGLGQAASRTRFRMGLNSLGHRIVGGNPLAGLKDMSTAQIVTTDVVKLAVTAILVIFVYRTFKGK